MYEMITGVAGLGAIFLLCKLVFGFLNCFFGYKLLKIWVAFCGFLAGFTVGLLVVPHFVVKEGIILLISCGMGLVLGVLGYEVYLVGAFVLGWILTVSVFLSLGRMLKFDDKMVILMLGVGVLAGIAVGALIVRFSRPGIILLTAVSGGITLGMGVLDILKVNNSTAVFAAGIILSLCGVCVQLKTTQKI